MDDIDAASANHEKRWREEGFAPWQTAGQFVPGLTNLFYKRHSGFLTFRAAVHDRHCNGHRIAHGGFLATMADTWLAYNVADALPPDARFSTRSLTMNYVKSVRAGDCIESQVDRLRTGNRLCFASGAILCGGKPIAFMSAEFALMNIGPSPKLPALYFASGV